MIYFIILIVTQVYSISKNLCVYGMGQRLSHSLKKTIYQQVLKLGANEASAQGLQNAL